MIEGTITKTGNSYAIRVPKSYIVNNHLKLGDKVPIEEPLVVQQKALDKLVKQATKTGAIPGILDPVKWQRELRESSDPWDKKSNDSAR